VERSHGKIRADVAHETLTAMGYVGPERTTRRAVAQLKANRAAGGNLRRRTGYHQQPHGDHGRHSRT
jgi:hypothetical protein